MATSSLVLHKGRPVHHGSVQGGIAKYQELAGGQPGARDASYRPERVEFELLRGDERVEGDPVRLDYGDRVALVGTHAHPEPVSLSVILHEGNGPTIADYHSARSGFQVAPGERFRLDVGALELCPGYYQWVVVGFGHDGTQHFLSRPMRFKIEGLHLGTTRWQPRGTWRVLEGARGEEQGA
jgi:hypothetical protein